MIVSLALEVLKYITSKQHCLYSTITPKLRTAVSTVSTKHTDKGCLHNLNMLFTTLFLLAGLASAAPALDARQVTTEFAPWEITAASSARRALDITIKQPNTIRLQRVPRGYAVLPSFEADCAWTWEQSGSPPFGVETLCTTVGENSAYGNFTATLSGTDQGDLKADIKETREVTIFQQQYVRVFEGEQAFNEESGWKVRCGAGGACNWAFRGGELPVKVKQELTTSVGSCEEATVGGC
ncbi:hypothetical protein B5807_05103 [Epicoccum nigrum]|uniref:Uncharacterized protein n=1 Tax=Epicoccum nigrum TaxID=105696 RepID=A0A1Y2M368_EPING|nr:hypothetical protein B5807_05103 [Epicoccum nigrum]